MRTIEKTGKTFEEAKRAALDELGLSEEKVEITVLDHGSKGFLGLGQKPCKISVKIIFNPEDVAVTFLKDIALALKTTVIIKTEKDEKHLNINITGEDVGVFIGKHGQTLDALQYLTSLVVNKGNAPYLAVNIDVENYRQKRKETLESLAHNLAKKVKITKKSVYLEPMSSHERRIIHAALQNERGISTYSEGDEPSRYVVIALKEWKREKHA